MALTTKIEGPRDLAFLLSEIDHLSREVVTIKAGNGVLEPGTVMGEILADKGAVTVGTPVLTGTGNGTLTKATPAYGTGVQEGTYTVRCVEKTTDSGEFIVIRPDGTIDGSAVIGTAYDGQIKFTLADGSADFDQTSSWAVPVSVADPAGVGTWKKSPLTGTDGSEIAKGVLSYGVDATSVDVQAVIHRRIAAVKKSLLVFDASVDDATKIATKLGQLAVHNIIAR